MAKQYSFIVNSRGEVTLVEIGLSLVPGRNVFCTTTKDIKALLAILELEGVQVLELHRMDPPETTASDLLLEGESLAVLSPHAWRPRS